MKKIFCILLASTLLSSPCLAFTNSDIDITLTQVPLSTRLGKYYSGYEYSIVNQSKSPINIVNAQIVNGQNGNVAYTNMQNQEPSAMARTWAIAGPIGLFTLGIGWAAGLVATPFVAISTNKNKRKAQSESIAYSNILTLGLINSGESTQVSTLVPIGSKPQLKITIQDTKTKELHTVSY